MKPARVLVAEGLGTLLLVCTVVGSGIMAERLAAGNVAIALLGNTIATGAILVVLITALGPVSGAHFNPAVSMVMAIRGDIGRGLALGFVMVQVAGGLAGTILAHLMFEEPALQLSTKARTGLPQLLSEAVATFGLVFTILATVRARPAAVPWAVGLYISAAYWFTASTSFANPAVTVARAVSDSFSGIDPSDMPGFIAAQLIGAVLANLLARWMLAPNSPGEEGTAEAAPSSPVN